VRHETLWVRRSSERVRKAVGNKTVPQLREPDLHLAVLNRPGSH